jgi:hypothetical protein
MGEFVCEASLEARGRRQARQGDPDRRYDVEELLVQRPKLAGTTYRSAAKMTVAEKVTNLNHRGRVDSERKRKKLDRSRPSSRSMVSSRLYFATRSERQSEPVFI